MHQFTLPWNYLEAGLCVPTALCVGLVEEKEGER